MFIQVLFKLYGDNFLQDLTHDRQQFAGSSPYIVQAATFPHLRPKEEVNICLFGTLPLP